MEKQARVILSLFFIGAANPDYKLNQTSPFTLFGNVDTGS